MAGYLPLFYAAVSILILRVPSVVCYQKEFDKECLVSNGLQKNFSDVQPNITEGQPQWQNRINATVSVSILLDRWRA